MRNDLNEAFHVDMCAETSHGLRGQVVWKLGRLVGMQAEGMINQEAPDHAVACAFGAGLLGQLTPAFIWTYSTPARYVA